MRVLHVSPSFARTDGGPSEVIRGLIPALQARGIKAHVFSTDKGISGADNDLMNVSWLRYDRSLGPSSLTYSPSLARSLKQFVAQYDLVHVHGWQSYPGTVAMNLARRAEVPFLIEPHGALDAYHWAQNRVRKRVYLQMFDRRNVQGLSAALYSTPLEENFGARVLSQVRPARMTLGVDEQLFAQPMNRRRAHNGAPTILYLGRITKKKRLDLVLRAMAQSSIRGTDARLVVAGGADGSISDPAVLAAALRITDRVEFLGPVDSAMRLKLLTEATVFVLPSEDESFGVAVAEAMAAGLPVVTSRNVGIAEEALARGALVVSESTPGDIAAGILTAIESDTVGANARQYALENFRWALAAQQAEAVYKECLAQGGRA